MNSFIMYIFQILINKISALNNTSRILSLDDLQRVNIHVYATEEFVLVCVIKIIKQFM